MGDFLTWLLDYPGVVLLPVGLAFLVWLPLALGLGSIRRGRRDALSDVSGLLEDEGWGRPPSDRQE